MFFFLLTSNTNFTIFVTETAHGNHDNSNADAQIDSTDAEGSVDDVQTSKFLFVPRQTVLINQPLKSRLFLHWFTSQTLILVVQSVVSACTNCGVRTERAEVCQRCLRLAKCKVCLRHLAPHCFHATDICHACYRKVTKTRIRRAVEEVVNETTLPTTSGDMSFDHFIEDNANYIRQIVDTYRQRFGCVLLCFSLSQ